MSDSPYVRSPRFVYPRRLAAHERHRARRPTQNEAKKSSRGFEKTMKVYGGSSPKRLKRSNPKIIIETGDEESQRLSRNAEIKRPHSGESARTYLSAQTMNSK